MHLKSVLPLFLILASLTPVRADTDGSQADYDRANNLDQHTRNLLPTANVDPRWSPDASTLWYSLHTDGHTTYTLINTATGAREERTTEPTFASLSSTPATQPTTHPSTQPATRPARQGRQFNPFRAANSPDGHYTALIRNNNIVLRDRHTQEITPLTTDATPKTMPTPTANSSWSPDSTKLVALKTLAGQKHPVYEVESSPTDQEQPKLHPFDYLKPGDKIPCADPISSRSPTKKRSPCPDTLFPNPWSLEDVRWDTDLLPLHLRLQSARPPDASPPRHRRRHWNHHPHH